MRRICYVAPPASKPPSRPRGRGGPVARDGDLRSVIGPPTLPRCWGAMALMAERIFFITAIVLSIVVPIAVMVALVYMK